MAARRGFFVDEGYQSNAILASKNLKELTDRTNIHFAPYLDFLLRRQVWYPLFGHQELGLRLPSLPRPRFARAAAPGSASQAYLAFLADLEPLPELRREPAEPPASHSRRLRETGLADPGAARLAADYQLEQYARRSLGAPETNRALGRWRRLR